MSSPTSPPSPANQSDLTPFAPLLAEPARAGLFCDFDGTLSAIVPEPSAARPLDGAVDALLALAVRFGRVGVLSGRPAAFVAEFFPPPLVIAGLYGLETRIDGERRDHPDAGRWREVVADVVAASSGGPDGMRIESKGLSLTAHYRGRPEVEDAVRAWAAQQATRSGLELRPAKMSFELHPPLAVDKGTAIRELSAGLAAVAFFGDDVGDLPAYDALDELGARGWPVVKVAAGGPEQADELVARADVVTDGPAGAVALLVQLRAALEI